MNEVMRRVLQMRDSMTKKERVVADMVISDPVALVTRSISDYAKHILSSPATITRFCQRIGLSGFSELRFAISNNIPDGNYEGSDPDEASAWVDLTTAQATKDIASGVVANAISSLRQLLPVVSTKSVEDAADLILGARHIMLCGIGASALVARDIQQKLVRLGILPHFEENIDVEKSQLAAFNEKDVVVALSYSGTKKEVCEIVGMAKSKQAKVIAMTKLGSNPIAQAADVRLAVAPTEPLVRECATVSRLQMLTVVDMLFQVLVKKSGGVFETLMESWSNVSEKGGGLGSKKSPGPGTAGPA